MGTAGGDLAGLIARTKARAERLEEMAVWAYLAQLSSALAHLHGMCCGYRQAYAHARAHNRARARSLLARARARIPLSRW